jgi:microcystin degradation protein MlrC
MRIAVAQFMHETVTFLPNDTTREDFIYDGSPLTGEALLQSGKKSYLGGFVKVAREFDEVELIGLSSPGFPKTGIGSGWVTSDAYEWFVGEILGELRAMSPVDGVYLALHGAMAVRGVDRPEAELVRRIRHLVGPEVFIAATFDPHGNEDEMFLEVADLAFCAKYYPHYDEYLQGNRAARTLVRAIRADFRPSHATCKVPILTPTVAQWTGAAPWSTLVQRALMWEARATDLYINVFFGFPWSDVIDAGMCIQAIADDDAELARGAATDMAEFAWRMRTDLVTAASTCSIREGIKEAKSVASTGPLVLADHSDRSGSATWLLAEVLKQELSHTLIATVADRTLARRLEQIGAKPGDPFDMEVGGKTAESDGTPVRVVGQLLNIVRTHPPPEYAGNSPWIVVGFGTENILIVTPFLAQIMEPSLITDYLGISLAGIRVIALKSRVHFRRGFVDSGFTDNVQIVEPDQPSLGTTRLDALRYENLRIDEYYPYGRSEFRPQVIVGSSRQ